MGVRGFLVTAVLSLRPMLAVASTAMLLMAVTPTAPAQAQWWQFDEPRGYQDRRYYRKAPAPPRERRPRESVRAPAPVATAALKNIPVSEFRQSGPDAALLAVISLAGQKVSVYDDRGRVLSASVSTGKPGHPTPTGIFSIIQKRRYHESNIYSGAPMPFMQRITWSGIALHAGRLPGYPASHGCVRLPDGVASRLFEMTKLGTRVVIAPSETSAQPISHTALPVPRMTPAAAAVVTASLGTVTVPVTVADRGPDLPVDGARLSPHQRAIAERTRAREQAKAAKALVPLRLDAARLASARSDALEQDVRSARAQQAALEARYAALSNRASTAASETAIAAEIAASEQREERLADGRIRLGQIEHAADVASQAAFDAAQAVRVAQEASDDAEAATKLADKAINPVTVFISRKEKRVLVRQGFEQVYEAPVEIDGAAPLGTHLIAALGVDEAAGSLSWTAVTVPESERRRELASGSRGRAVADSDLDLPPSTAAEALSRIKLSPETRAWIEDRVWHGAAVIVSDHGVSNETGLGTDFVVLTK